MQLDFDNFTVEANIMTQVDLKELSQNIQAIIKKCIGGEAIQNSHKFFAVDVEKAYYKCKVTDVPLFIIVKSKVLHSAGVVGLPIYDAPHYTAYCYSDADKTYF